MPRRQLWLIVGAPLVALLVLFVGPAARAQDYPPTTTSTTIDHGHDGDHGNHGSTSTTNPHSHGNGNGNGNGNGKGNGTAVAGDQFQATTTTADPTVLGVAGLRRSGGLPFTGAQVAGLVILALSLITVGAAAVLRARRPRSTTR